MPTFSPDLSKLSPCDACVLQARQIYFTPQAPETSRWRVVSGQDEGAQITITRSMSAQNLLTIEESTPRVTKIQLKPDGSCALISMDSVDGGTKSIFDPPLLMCANTLKSNAPLRSESSMQAVLVESGTARDQGTATRTISIDGMARITTELGTFDCIVVSTHFIGTLGKAKIDTQMTIWIAPDIGSIAEKYRQKITILGLFTKNSERFIEKLPQEN